MHRRLPLLVPVVFLSVAAASLTAAAQAQTPPTLTFTPNGSGTGTLGGQAVFYEAYLFSITGFSNVGPDPNNNYTIYSFSNSSIEASPDFRQIASGVLPAGWTFSDTNDFVISTLPQLGIHATDPTFGLTVFQKAGTPVITPDGAPFELFHQINGVDPFLNPDGTPLMITAQAVPEASSLVSFGLLLLGGLAWKARRKPRAL